MQLGTNPAHLQDLQKDLDRTAGSSDQQQEDVVAAWAPGPGHLTCRAGTRPDWVML